MSGIDADLVEVLGGWLKGTGITCLELRTAAGTILLRRDPGPAPAAAALPVPAPAAATTAVLSPGVGVLLHRHPLGGPVLAEPGQAVAAGDAVGLLRVGGLLQHVLAPVDGIVAPGMTPDGTVVGYGAPLLRLERNAE